jgi:hypothetical protein
MTAAAAAAAAAARLLVLLLLLLNGPPLCPIIIEAYDQRPCLADFLPTTSKVGWRAG